MTEGVAMTFIVPDLKGLVDDDIIARFEGVGVLCGDIINAQLIKTNKELIKVLNKEER